MIPIAKAHCGIALPLVGRMRRGGRRHGRQPGTLATPPRTAMGRLSCHHDPPLHRHATGRDRALIYGQPADFLGRPPFWGKARYRHLHSGAESANLVPWLALLCWKCQNRFLPSQPAASAFGGWFS